MRSKGICRLCGKTFTGGGMAKHLLACPERKKELEKEKGRGKVFLIRASSGLYWVYFEANDSHQLLNVDTFLRRLWLECCGHLSAFTINSDNFFLIYGMMMILEWIYLLRT